MGVIININRGFVIEEPQTLFVGNIFAFCS